MPSALPALLEVTDAHRQQAFAAMAWAGWTYEQAMADPVRSRIVECRAHQMRTQQWRQQAWRRVSWPAVDGKRATAGDRD